MPLATVLHRTVAVLATIAICLPFRANAVVNVEPGAVQVSSVVTSGNVTISNPGTASFGGVTLTSGDRLLLTDQTSDLENGIWRFNGSGSALTRPPEFTGTVHVGALAHVNNGPNAGSTWRLHFTGRQVGDDVVQGTDDQFWVWLDINLTYAYGTLPLSKGGTGNTGISACSGDDVIRSNGTLLSCQDPFIDLEGASSVTGVLPTSRGGSGRDDLVCAYGEVLTTTSDGSVFSCVTLEDEFQYGGFSPRDADTVDIASISAGSCLDTSFSLTGADAGAECILGLPTSPASGVVFTCYVSAADTVKIRACNVTGSAVDPGSATYSVRVFNP